MLARDRTSGNRYILNRFVYKRILGHHGNSETMDTMFADYRVRIRTVQVLIWAATMEKMASFLTGCHSTKHKIRGHWRKALGSRRNENSGRQAGCRPACPFATELNTIAVVSAEKRVMSLSETNSRKARNRKCHFSERRQHSLQRKNSVFQHTAELSLPVTSLLDRPMTKANCQGHEL